MSGLRIYRDGKLSFDTNSGAVRILAVYKYEDLWQLRETERGGGVRIKIRLPDVGSGQIFAYFLSHLERHGSDSLVGSYNGYYYVEDGVFHIFNPVVGESLILGVYYDSTS